MTDPILRPALSHKDALLRINELQDELTDKDRKKLDKDLRDLEISVVLGKKGDALARLCYQTQLDRAIIAAQKKHLDFCVQHHESELKALRRELSEYRATLEKVKMNHSAAWDYAVRHPNNAGLGILSIIEGVDDVLSKYSKADKEGKDMERQSGEEKNNL